MAQEITPQEIKDIRGKYGLSQKAFARVLGIGDASIVRYENGAQPTRAIANLIRAASNPGFFLDCLRRAQEDVPQAEEVQRVIYSMITFDKEGNAMDINDMYEITLDKEVLGEKAAEVIGKLVHKKIQAEEQGLEDWSLLYRDLLALVWRLKEDVLLAETDRRLLEIKGMILGVEATLQMGAEKVA